MDLEIPIIRLSAVYKEGSDYAHTLMTRTNNVSGYKYRSPLTGFPSNLGKYDNDNY